MAGAASNYDIVDIDLTRDGDVCDEGELRHLYQQPYVCASRKAIGLDKLYILHIDCHWNGSVVACGLSNNSVHVASIDTLTKISTFVVHEQTVVGLKFDVQDPNCLYTAANDGLVRVWDLRETKKAVREFKNEFLPPGGKGGPKVRPLLSFDVDSGSRYLCAGTEQMKQDAFLMLWDLRQSKLLSCFSELHQDDVTDVKFHPTDNNVVASCSTDGLVNIFDLTSTEEDDALQYCLNAETTCDRLQWLQSAGADKQVSVTTHTEGVQFWKIDDAAPQHSFSREQIRDSLKRRKTETCYIVQCFQKADETLVLAGSNTPGRGCLRLLKLDGGQLKPYGVLDDEKGRDAQTVRCAQLNPQDGLLISGGESGIINVWKQGQKGESQTEAKLISKTKKTATHSNKPYAKESVKKR